MKVFVWVVCLVVSAVQVRASVTIFFEEIGGNVVATTSGSFLVPTDSPLSSGSGTSFMAIGDQFYNLNGSYNEWFASSMSSTLINQNATSASGDTFGFGEIISLFLPAGLTPGTSYTPNTTWTWDSMSLSDIGLGALTTTPEEVFAGPGSVDTISIAKAVPEPSTVLLLTGGLAGLAALRRKRKR